MHNIGLSNDGGIHMHTFADGSDNLKRVLHPNIGHIRVQYRSNYVCE